MKQFYRSVFLVSPFLSFLFGYFFISFFFHSKSIVAPNFIGKSIQQTLKIASAAGLNIRLLREQEDPDMAEGVVLEQAPKAHRLVKSNQYFFVTLSKHSPSIVAPNVLHQKHEFLSKQAKKLGVRTKTCWVKSCYPKGVCIAQSPQPGAELKSRSMMTYLSLGNGALFVFPKLCGMLVGDVLEFLEGEGIKAEVVHFKRVGSAHSCGNCRVLDQKPMAGTIVDKKLYVQLQVGDS
ncbi:PASTA domain-containing protein [Candidatus Dependentiae bacterium]|nr:PASTA domain-containing protein [Candidatus Dependentiae bacterium]